MICDNVFTCFQISKTRSFVVRPDSDEWSDYRLTVGMYPCQTVIQNSMCYKESVYSIWTCMSLRF